MDNIKNFIITLLNNRNYLEAISIIVVAFTSYQVAKYNVSRPNKFKVKQQQLDFVYLPLYRLLSSIPTSIDREQADTIEKQIHNILDSHYEFAFPQLHVLDHEFRKAIELNADYTNVLHTIYHQVSVDYELLKRFLGYPSQSIFTLFVRMTTKQKCVYIISYVNLLWLLSPIYLPFLLPAFSIKDSFSSAISIFFLTTIPLFVCNFIIQKMSD